MDTELILRFAAIAIAAFVVITGVKLTTAINFVKDLFKRKQKPVTTDKTKPVNFLDIVSSWHILRNQCEVYGLHDAVKKIDDVFPLLNGGEEDD